jgi:glycerol kinase
MSQGRMSQGHVLAIDQGTTSTRAMLFDAQGRVVSTAQKELPDRKSVV